MCTRVIALARSYGEINGWLIVQHSNVTASEYTAESKQAGNIGPGLAINIRPHFTETHHESHHLRNTAQSSPSGDVDEWCVTRTSTTLPGKREPVLFRGNQLPDLLYPGATVATSAQVDGS